MVGVGTQGHTYVHMLGGCSTATQLHPSGAKDFRKQEIKSLLIFVSFEKGFHYVGQADLKP